MPQRALHGVNLTGWLTLEPWVTPELFAESGALDELSLLRSLGERDYRRLVIAHRQSFLSQQDFTRIAGRGFNAVRLPVPWYVFGEAGPSCGPFVGCADQVDRAFAWAEDIDLKIILALDVSLGNEGALSEVVGTHDEFSHYRQDLIDVVTALSKRYAHRTAFAGIELAGEVRPQLRRGLTLSEGVPLHLVRNYYRDAYESVRAEAGDDVAVILPDAGQPDAWRGFMAGARYKNVWLDCHLFHYNDAIDATGPTGVSTLCERSAAYLKRAEKSGLPVMVGEWSASLPFADSMTTPEGRIALERVYVSGQIAAFSGCTAWFFQTWKTSGRLVGWDARIALATFERRMLD